MSQWVYFDEEKEPMIKGIDNELMACVDRARHRAKIPFIVTSGFRTPEHNAEVGGVPDSAHTTGHALDLKVSDAMECFRIVEALLHEGAQRIVIGIDLVDGKVAYHNVHVDNDPTKPTPVFAIKRYG